MIADYGYGDADVSLDQLCGQPLDWSRFLGRKKLSFFRQYLALGRMGVIADR